MSIILDIIVLAVIAITALISAKRGFVRVAIELVGFILALFIAFTASTPLAEATYDNLIEPKIVSVVSETVENVAGQTAGDATDAIWNGMPNWLKSTMDKVGIDQDKTNEVINETVSNGAENTEQVMTEVSQKSIKPIIVTPIELLYTSIIAIILILVVKLLAGAVNKLFSFSIVGKVNRLLGGLVGIVKGVIIAMLLCMVFTLIVSFTENGIFGITNDVLESTYIFNKLVL